MKIPTLIASLCLAATFSASAQTFTRVSTCDSMRWKPQKNVTLAATATGKVVPTDPDAPIVTFHRWGTTINEQDWRALCMLKHDEQAEILQRTFAPDGELRFSTGRISMNANDYALEWFSCSEVPGDFENKHFNIEHDKLTIIPYARAAQHYRPDMNFWMSPWSPPAWMKINHHYAVQSSPYSDMDPRLDHLLYKDDDRSHNEQEHPDPKIFPRRMAVQDFFVQEPRYLQCYADQFARFIDLYAEQGIDIGMVMYQNEAYSYTPYPGCPWTSEGILRFNMEYLAPTLQAKHPGVELYLGTFNTNRYDHVKELLNDKRVPENIKGLAFQWEGGQILPRIHSEHPGYKYIASESECGWGAMDWAGAERTFYLINHYIGHGCSDYTNWNLILCDQGESRWGWKQNALIRVDSATRTYEYTPEYYCYRHYSQFMPEGTKVVGRLAAEDGAPVMAAVTPEGKYVVIAGNLSDVPQEISVQIGRKYLNATLDPHSFHTFAQR